MTDRMMANAFACADAKEQAEFLKSVGAIFRTWRSTSPLAGMEMQFYYIAKYLNGDGFDFVQKLSENIEAQRSNTQHEIETLAAARDLLKWEIESLETRKKSMEVQP